MTPLQNLGAPSDTEELGTPLEVRFGSVVETEASNCATSFYFATISRFASDQTSSDALPIISSRYLVLLVPLLVYGVQACEYLSLVILAFREIE